MNIPNQTLETFNEVSDFLAYSSFSVGDAKSTAPEFTLGQLEYAIQNARMEIASATQFKANEEFGLDINLAAEAELCIATAKLYERLGERIGLLTQDANATNVGNVGLGADTPPPTGEGSKMIFFCDKMAKQFRDKADYLLGFQIRKPFIARSSGSSLFTELNKQSDYWKNNEV